MVEDTGYEVSKSVECRSDSRGGEEKFIFQCNSINSIQLTNMICKFEDHFKVLPILPSMGSELRTELKSLRFKILKSKKRVKILVEMLKFVKILY